MAADFVKLSDGPVLCAHCGLEVPDHMLDPDAELQFCCNGCKTVFEVLHGAGLEQFYEYNRSTGDARPARTSDRSYSDFDDPHFCDTWCRKLPNGRLAVDLYLENVHCAACVWLVEKLPLKIPGVEECILDIRRSRVSIRWDPQHQQLGYIARFLDSLGYPSHPWRGSVIEEARKKEDRRLLIRIAIAGAAAGNVMLIAFSLYGGYFSGMSEAFRDYFRWISLAFTLPAVAWSGVEFYRGALASLRARSLHMDLPITIGIASAFLWGSWNTVRGTGEIYFDTLTILIFLLLCGRWLVRKQQRHAADAAELLYTLTPSVARRVTEGEITEVPLQALSEGDLVEVRSGDTIPADGRIEQGTTRLDLSLLTGESIPQMTAEGDVVFAGTTNMDARILVRIQRSGEETRLGRLMMEIEAAASRKAPVVQLADRLSGWFVLAVLSLALLTFGLWLKAGMGVALDHAISLLIVTCPCALGLATPLAVGLALGRAARLGILVRGADVIENLSRGGKLLLDKTGTLTEGQYGLVMQQASEDCLTMAAALEQHSSHPVALALMRAADKPEHSAAEDVHTTPGAGIEGRVNKRQILVGSLGFFESQGIIPNSNQQVFLESCLEQGLTTVLCAIDGRLEGIFGLGDKIRPAAKRTVDHMRKLGWEPQIISGDHSAVVKAVGQQLGIPEHMCRGEFSPEEKLALVESLQQQDPVVMVGDGVNDAAALAAARVGVSVRGGAEASLAAADVYLSREGFEQLSILMRGSIGTMRTIRLNLIFSLLYNIVGASLAILGYIHPITAAVLMPISSLTVVFLSLQNRSFRARRS